MHKRSVKSRTKVRAAVAGSVIFLGFLCYLVPADPWSTAYSQVKRRTQTRSAPRPLKYSAFPHDKTAHRLECATCHKFPSANWNKVRPAASAFPDITDYPRHESCLNCHRQQFFRGRPPAICSICHTNPGPRDSSRHPFPNPREVFDLSAKGKLAESDFQISLPHDKHIEIVSSHGAATSVFRNASFSRRRARAEESCAVCHTTLQPQGNSDSEYVTKPPASLGDGFWLKKGTFKSVPTGHTTCFTCHSPDTGISPTPSDCATCHKIKPPAPAADFDARLASKIGISDRVTLEPWRTRHSAGAFRHEFASHADLSCDTCHTVQTMNTLDLKTTRVPVTACAMCHVTATVDDGGVMNFEVQSRKTNATFQCTKCHITFGKLPVPQSHLQTIVEAGGEP